MVASCEDNKINLYAGSNLPELPIYKEGDLEDALITNQSQFLLELGKDLPMSAASSGLTSAGESIK